MISVSSTHHRIIFHVDLDCFFAAVEIVQHPEYRGKPVVVGADPKQGYGRGVVTTASYEARKFGIHSGQPISQAWKACPHAIYVYPNFTAIEQASHRVMDLLRKHSNAFQQTGIDEAYLEMTEFCDYSNAKTIAIKIQDDIQAQTDLSVSIGIGPTKSLAKIATDLHKPHGIMIIFPDQIESILSELDVNTIPGIGKKSKYVFYEKGYKKVKDLFRASASQLYKDFGNCGKWIWMVIHGLDDRDIIEWHDRKSISEERTFAEDIQDYAVIKGKIKDLYQSIHKELKEKGQIYRTISLKIRFQGFETFLRSRTAEFPIDSVETGIEILNDLLQEFVQNPKKVRLVGVKLSQLEPRPKRKQNKMDRYYSGMY